MIKYNQNRNLKKQRSEPNMVTLADRKRQDLINEEEYKKDLIRSSLRNDTTQFSYLLNEIPENKINDFIKFFFLIVSDLNLATYEQFFVILFEKNNNNIDNLIFAINTYFSTIKINESFDKSDLTKINPQTVQDKINKCKKLIQILISKIDQDNFAKLHQDTKKFCVKKLAIAPEEWLDDCNTAKAIIQLPSTTDLPELSVVDKPNNICKIELPASPKNQIIEQAIEICIIEPLLEQSTSAIIEQPTEICIIENYPKQSDPITVLTELPTNTPPINSSPKLNTVYLDSFYHILFHQKFTTEKNVRLLITTHSFNKNDEWEFNAVCRINNKKLKFKFRLIPQDNLATIFFKNKKIAENIELANSPETVIEYIKKYI
jgi:hypothetical protein